MTSCVTPSPGIGHAAGGYLTGVATPAMVLDADPERDAGTVGHPCTVMPRGPARDGGEPR